MRLSEIRLEKYGPFEDLTLALDPAPGRVNLIVAPNGAGKSVLRRAFGDLLFGIHAQSPMGFRYGYAEMRISARAAMADGTALAFRRRKGMGNTLLDEAGAPLDPARLGMLPDNDIFQRLFALDTTLLRKGGAELLDRKGDVGSLMLAAAGLSDARAALRMLEAESGTATFIRKDAKSPLNIAVTDLRDARRRADDALLRPADWKKRADLLADALAARDAARARAVAAEAARDRLARINALRAPLRQHDEAAAWLAAHPEAPNLPATLGPRLEAAARALADAAARAEAGQRGIADLQTRLAALPQHAALLAARDAIRALDGPAGAAAQALRDLPARRNDHATALANATALLRDIGSDLTPVDAHRLLPDAATREAAEALIRDHATLQASEAAATLQNRKRAADLADISSELASLPDTAADDALPRLLREIRAEGDPVKQAGAAAEQRRAAEAALVAALSRMPLWSGDAAALAALRLHPPATYAARHAALAAARDTLARKQEAAKAASASHAAARAALDAATARAPAADPAAVQAARAHRDAGWRLIARLAFGGDPVSPEEKRGFGGAEHLALAYERAVAAADRLADLRADASAAVAQAVQARAAAQDAAEADTAAQHALADAARAVTEAETAWQALLPAGVPPDTSHDALREFIAARDNVIRALQTAETARGARDALAATHALWAARLGAQLGQPAASAHPAPAGNAPPASPAPASTLPGSGAPGSDVAGSDVAGSGVPGSGAPFSNLAALLLAADARIEAATHNAQRRTALQAKLHTLTTQQAEHEAAAAAAAATRAAWAAGWAALLSRLGRPASETPAVTAAMLKRLDALRDALAEAGRAADRLAQIDAFTASFITACAHTLQAAGETHPTDTAEQALAAANALKTALENASATAAQRATLSQQLAAAETAQAGLTAELAARTTAQAMLLAEIGAPDPAAARQLLDQAETRATHAATLAQATQDIAARGDGLPLDQLRAEIAAIAEADMAPALDAARAEAATAGLAREDATAEVTRLQRALDEAANSTAYAEARAAEADAAARAGETLRDALRTRLAHLLLAEALATFETQSQPEMLRRIGQWFTRLTNGAYPTLGVDQERQPPALLLFEDGRTREPKHVEDLSEGTRDQLFLALRLAAIETHPALLPFIADDILQSFDDARAAAALDALRVLSQRVQVILLTHHDHVARLAGAGVHLVAFKNA